MAKGLTPRQRKFVEVFEGNATAAARKAGYTGSDAALGKSGFDLLRNPKVQAALAERDSKSDHIATREERQRFWTRTMQNPGVEYRDRLKASELLGRSNADFVEKMIHEAGAGLAEIMATTWGERSRAKAVVEEEEKTPVPAPAPVVPADEQYVPEPDDGDA